MGTPPLSVRLLNVTRHGCDRWDSVEFRRPEAGTGTPTAFPTDEVSLRETTFVVVDLETTGGRSQEHRRNTPPTPSPRSGRSRSAAASCSASSPPWWTRSAASRPRSCSSPASPRAMVCDAPTIDAVLPMFLEFAGDAVLVAHNAGFDIGFLRAAAERCEIPWPRPQVLCTVRLARRVLSREEAPSVRLAALARLFAVATQPTHRALDDARATVDVLHALIERVGNQGVHTYADLRAYLPDVTPAQRRKRVLADGLPRRPGVYLFRGPSGEVLYVGTAVDLRRRVSQYFNGADPRGRMKEMVALAERRRPCRMRARAGGRRARAADCWPHTPRRTTAGRRFPHRWWWVVLYRRGVSATVGGAGAAPRPRHRPVSVARRRRRDRGAAGAVHRGPHLHRRGWRVRRCTGRPAPSSRCRPARPARDVTATQYAAAVGPRRGLDRRAGQQRAGRGRASGRRAGRAAPLRERRATARPHRRRRRGAVARPAAARAGRAARTGRRGPGRRRRLPPRRHPPRPARRGRHRQARGAADAGRRRHSRWRPGDPARAGAAGRRAGRGDRAHRALAGRAGGAHRAGLATTGGPRRCGRPARGRRGRRRRARRGWPAQQTARRTGLRPAG